MTGQLYFDEFMGTSNSSRYLMDSRTNRASTVTLSFIIREQGELHTLMLTCGGDALTNFCSCPEGRKRRTERGKEIIIMSVLLVITS